MEGLLSTGPTPSSLLFVCMTDETLAMGPDSAVHQLLGLGRETTLLVLPEGKGKGRQPKQANASASARVYFALVEYNLLFLQAVKLHSLTKQSPSQT